MDNLQKTELGIQALKQRNKILNAKQRRLLVLIGTKDFEILPPLIKRKIATEEILEQLLKMGMICLNETSSNLSLESNKAQISKFQPLVF